MYEVYFEKRSSEVSINSVVQKVHNNKDSPSTSSIIVEEQEAPHIVTTSEEQTSLILLNNADEFNQEDSAHLMDSEFELTAYSDADHAGWKDDCKSTLGGLQFLGEKLVSWSSKKKDYTVMSTAKAEYVSLHACCAQSYGCEHNY
ncbi:hypothetical protein Tco_1541176 [Tanacetum coccineum]